MTDGPPPGRDNPWHGTTTVVRRDAVRIGSPQSGSAGTGDILTFAGRTMWHGLLAQGSSTNCI